ncbi:trypsin zeta-like [Drosophila tropicalis]|uniref:trypsin zeta-like n=1 Tax=Drosophila tropicalis TaxID=46794 RepID=UPI0035ABD296
MKFIAFFIFLTCSQSSAALGNSNRILNGVPINIRQAPYQVWMGGRVLNDEGYGKVHCGGAVISQRVVLTVESCFLPTYYSQGKIAYNQYFIVAGCNYINKEDENTQKYQIQEVVKHSDTYVEDDIAIVLLNGYIPWDSPTIKAVALAERPILSKTSCLVSGWGMDKKGFPLNLMQAKVFVQSHSWCSENLPNFKISEICSNSTDYTTNDAGGPLVCSNELHGVALFDYNHPNRIGLYANISFYYKWIRAVNSSFNYSDYLNHTISGFETQSSFNSQETCCIVLCIFLVWTM